MTGGGAAVGTVAGPVASFLTVEPDNVVAITWKLGSRGNDSMLRLEEIAGKPEQVRVASPILTIKRAWICNVLGDRKREMTVGRGGLHVQVPAFGIVTLRLETEPKEAGKGGA